MEVQARDIGESKFEGSEDVGRWRMGGWKLCEDGGLECWEDRRERAVAKCL